MRVSTIDELAAAVRTLRQDRGWTQAEVARRAGVSRDWVNRLEGGSGRVEVAKVLDVLAVLGVMPTVESRPVSGDLESIVRAHTGRA